MKIINHPERKEWKQLLARPVKNASDIIPAVTRILNDVKTRGDAAVIEWTEKLDGVKYDQFLLPSSEWDRSVSMLDEVLKDAILVAKKNIEKFHRENIHTNNIIETMPGVQCWKRSVGIEKVGLYIPGGTAPLFSTVLMLGVPAMIAGCDEIILCTPASEGVHPAIVYAAELCGIKKIFRVGGAQAVAAMAYGTESIPSVYKIFGPGNQYVTTAKQLVQMEGIAIDMPAGPSEVCIIADEVANPEFIAADLLSQAEHGADSQVLLITTSEKIADLTIKEVERQCASLSRNDIAKKALENSKAIVVATMDEAIDLANAYAAEHLIIACIDAERIADDIVNAGSVFIGSYSPESVGDYASGTNHTLPTNGFARAYSGVSVDSFVKNITFQKLTKQGLERIADTVIRMAEAEGLSGHAKAVSVRIK